MNSPQLENFIGLALAPPAAFRKSVIRDHNPQSGRTKYRAIYAPANDQVYENHRAIIGYLETVAGPMPYAFGAVKGRSPLWNVLAHRGFPSRRFPRFWYQTDITDAYGSVRLEPLVEALVAAAPDLAEHGPDLRRVLARHCFVWEEDESAGETCHGLYTGGPASPLLFNLYCDYWLDGRLASLGFGYSRYLDDLTFSSHSPIGRRARKRIMEAVRRAGFQPSLRKTERVDLRKKALRVTGLVLHVDGRIGLTQRYAGELRALAHRTEKELDRIEGGALALFIPRGISGSFGVLVGLARSRGPFDIWRGDLFERPAPPAGFTAAEWSLLCRFHKIRSRIKALHQAGRLAKSVS